jgi:tRNA(fMet)-specific endonuclease VapC
MLRDDATSFWQKIETDILPLVCWLDVDRSVASKAGDIAANLQRLGTPIGVNDCLIGGTALVHNLVLVSRNVRHFEKITNLLREVW